jgi:hypothetical protein
MPSRVRAITIEPRSRCFLSEVTGGPMDSEGDEAWVDITDDPDSIVPDLLFIRVPEAKYV